MFQDTIVALSTTLSPQAVAIIRLSGDKAVEIAQTLLHKNLEHSDHRISYGFIKDPLDQSDIDEVLVLVMKAPKSYTKEDVVEIQCHGGVYVTQRILSLTLSLGARLALAGEFTQRAVMNGRIDVAQAEAIHEMVNADSEQSAKLAINSLKGSLKQLIEPLKEELLGLIAQMEVNIDYPEYDLEQVTQKMLYPQCLQFSLQLVRILEESKSGQLMKEGLQTAIIGKPNVGKSSLLNALLNEDKAIVTEIAGTTRDIVEGSVRLKNVTLHLLDTAGIRHSEDTVEQIGIRKTFESMEKADLILFLVDAQTGLDTDEQALLNQLDPTKVMLVYNKKDLNTDASRLEISALHKDIHALIEALNVRYESHQFVFKKPVLFNQRTIGLAQSAYLSLRSALDALQQGLEVDLALIDLRACFTSLNAITGSEDFNLTEELFRRFCLGK